ncbi:MAG TPA: malonic semialdehyde reductase [Methyloceanibacter sp.]|nr:malonic semialdehyde reductase [Methyloceanibacter sp.]
MTGKLPDRCLDQIFHQARTHNAWREQGIPDSRLHELIELVKLGPTSANCSPARVLFVKSPEAKQRLKPLLSEGNREKTMKAPVCAIIGYDLDFYEHLPKLFPHTDARSWFADKPKKIEETAFRNGTLQGAYLIVAARALGLDCGPMSGFDNNGVDAEFFAGTKIKSNFLCSLGYGDASVLFPRSPRFDFDEIAKIL